MVELIDKTQGTISQCARLALIEMVQGIAADKHLASGGCFETTEEVQQGAFPATGGSNNGNSLTLADCQINALENLDRYGRFFKTLFKTLTTYYIFVRITQT